ncbi:MAG: hypothetical protein N3D11_03600 [Candidatus Sumerlaeia bacterium]|nr:hypothetical protein [Candidatus Sumerlaeia bacterium]
MNRRIARHAPRLLIALIVLVAAGLYSPQRYGIFADQMNYYLQANSLAFDGDLQFDEGDLARFRRHGWAEHTPGGLFLREADGRFYYSKPFLYSLAAVPLVWLAPVRGLIFLNALLWLALVEITFRWWRRFNPPKRAAVLAVLCWTACAAPFCLFVIHADLMIAFLLAMALYAWLVWECRIQERQGNGQPGAPTARLRIFLSEGYGLLALSGVCFGLAVYEKMPLALFVGAAAAVLLIRRQWPAAGILAATASLAFLLPTSVHLLEDGHFSPYQGRRVYCDSAFPFDDLKAASEKVAAHSAPGSEFFGPRLAQTILNPTYLAQFARGFPKRLVGFFVGRKTGLFPYLTPALLTLVLWLVLAQWRGRGRSSLAVATALAGYFLFYFIVLKTYYGGSTTIGNRYGLQVLPAFFFLVRQWPAARTGHACAVGALVAAGLYFPGYDLLTAYGKVRDNYDLFLKPRFRWLPFEWHLAIFIADRPGAMIDLGRTGKFLRLTERNPTHNEYAYFTVSARHQTALMTFTPRSHFPIRLTARSAPMAGWIGDGRRRQSFSLQPYESRVVAAPLWLRDRTDFSSFSLFTYALQIATTSLLEPNHIYPKEYFHAVGPFVSWLTDDRPSTPSQPSIFPDNPQDAKYLLWGWYGLERPDANGRQFRWAGESNESAVVLPAPLSCDSILRVVAECPVAMETQVVWNGRVVATWTIGPGRGEFQSALAAGQVREGDNILSLRHRWLWQPCALFWPDKQADTRWLSVHYLELTLAPRTILSHANE